jgi:hypothetical protein
MTLQIAPQITLRIVLLLVVVSALIVSGIAPYDRSVWWAEVMPVLIAVPIMVFTASRFPLTPLTYGLIALFALILILGGAYTYARGPPGCVIQVYFDLARTTRLALEKLVAARETAIKTEEVQRGKDELAKHIAALNTRLGKPYMPAVVADFATAIKGKRNPSSLKNAVDTLLSQKKIEASAIADAIQINLTSLRELAADYVFLFADTAQIVQKSNDDLLLVIKTRIADHKEAEQKRLEADRERIRAEEQEKAAKDAAAVIEADRKAQAQTILPTPANRSTEPTTPASVNPPCAPVATQDTKQGVVAPIDTGATMKLGEICNLLGFNVTSEFLDRLGFSAAKTDKNAKLYRQCDFPRICLAIGAHAEAVSRTDLRKAA